MDDIRKGRCPLCGHNEIIEGATTVGVPGQGIGAAPRVGSANIADVRRESFAAAFKRGLNGTPPPDPRAGRLITYACRECGFAQSFVANPRAVPIGKQFGTRILKGAELAELYR
jgi:hypothetical protein